MGVRLSKTNRNINSFDTNSQFVFSSTGIPKKFDREEENQGLNHCLIRELFKGNFSSPIRERLNNGGLTILDVGCGFGSWLFEMSSDFKNCQFIGVDITPQHFIANKPKNVNFITADITKGLPFREELFDFIHIRGIVLDLRDKEWDFLIQECVRVLKPGGYIEVTECETKSKNLGPEMEKFALKFRSYFAERNISILIVNRIEDIMKSNNLQHVVHYERPFPVGTWNSDFGNAFQTFNVELLRSVVSVFAAPKDRDSLLNNLIAECNN
ncbi:14659_t:CDS:2 [Dentiscutata heterogama]|uniref:14659_t:CDS:1 n=1 Tax=Dentiscutata heterogama TaxID=1316150 RepID=A0ACA9LF55_9GLOM|nr:14659_t:CDS:2 [Dentiscutata heterogama]